MGKVIFDDICELLNLVRISLGDLHSCVITIDGVDGSGKSKLARILSEKVDIEVIEIDSYVLPNRGGYLRFVRYEDLGRELARQLRDADKVIVEGVSILQVLEKLNVKPSLRIYVKRTTSDRIWNDGFVKFGNFERAAEEVITEHIEQAKKFNKLSNELTGVVSSDEELERDTLQDEIIRYHFDYMPHANADIVFENVIV